MSGDYRFDPATWDWSRPLFDHVQLHVRNVAASARFYETVLQPLGIPLVYAHDEQAEFPNLALVGGRPPSGPGHIAFRATSEELVQAFHRAGVEAVFRGA